MINLVFYTNFTFQVTKDFCDWVTNLGGDSNNVEESTIMSLFASGYETKVNIMHNIIFNLLVSFQLRKV